MSITFTEEHRARATDSQEYWLATVRPTPAGHVVPIWAVLVGDVFYMGTERTSQKIKNIQVHSRAALALPDTHHPIIFEGETAILERPFPPDVEEAFVSKYNWDLNEDNIYILISLTPDKLIAW
jgi:hypothetical protein